jgi:hypothetical protein
MKKTLGVEDDDIVEQQAQNQQRHEEKLERERLIRSCSDKKNGSKALSVLGLDPSKEKV